MLDEMILAAEVAEDGIEPGELNYFIQASLAIAMMVIVTTGAWGVMRIGTDIVAKD